MALPRVLIIDEMHPSIFPMLENIGLEADYRPDIKPAEVREALQGFEGLVVRSKMRITAETLELAQSLNYVARAGAGVDNIDVQALQERGIALVSANEGNRQAVGEFALGALLALMRNMNRSDRQVREKVWLREENRGEEISGKTVGIIGFGNMGQSFARVLAGFNCRLLAYDRYAPDKVKEPVLHVPLETIQAEADIVSLHIPYLPENLHLANDAFFSGFQKPVWFVNTSRGDVVDQAALVKHLRAGTLKGAALDVLENEKLQTLTAQQQENFSYLATSDQVILTPHIAGWTHESYLKINEVLVAKIAQLRQVP
ncbi:D-3-phosphoglycerate dehydrogenase [Pontibacter ummariensis]|uniref:D-3-phosphoglycerate dehydrogenase n=1 Tax=Pontibacter ummariensis TaxID=1610492 RepID=A0A239KQK5_9BACT|nr:NAD(P)-dependent oxidoreductase [Pontibacter ummariensis]PRY05370.1 D-3-phosphoglycerate dehydrogenase [Pontibacter ummariensis]SNT20012.1 D-3-phosphoglycerate dehydrogenase [Pontibacter ummariensis]